MSRLAKNTIIYAIGDIVPKLLNLVTFPILTSNLSTSDFGIINYINSIEAFLTIVTFLGLKTYYLVYYYKVEGEKEQKKLLGNLTIFIALFNLIVTALFLLLGDSLFRLVGSGNIPFFPYIVIGLIINFFSIFSVLPSALYRVQENPLPLTIINASKGFLIMAMTCYYIVKSPAAITVLNIKLFVTILFGAYFLYLTCKNSIFQFNGKQIKCALAFSLPIIPGDVAYYLSSMSDRILIEKYISAESLGIYSMAATLAGMLNILAYGAYKAFEPFFFKTFNSDLFVTNFIKVRSYLLFCLLPIGLCLIAFSREVIILFSTSGYHEAYLYVPPLTVGVLLSVLSNMYTTVLIAQAKTRICAIISIICACVSVVINICLLDDIGIWAAAIANVVIYLLTLYISKYFAHMRTKSSICFVSFSIFICFSVLCCYLISLNSIIISVLCKSSIIAIFIIILGRILEINPKGLVEMVIKK